MEEISTIGLDTAKSVFQVCAVDRQNVVLRNVQVKRRGVLKVFETIPSCTVALEACGAAFHWARQLVKMGHEVKLVPPPFLKRFAGRHKSDMRDAHALALAARDPMLRPVPLKSAEEQAGLMFVKVRSLLLRQRTQTSNSLRGHMAEFGLIGACGDKGLALLIERIEAGDEVLPHQALNALAILVRQWRCLNEEIAKLNVQLASHIKSNATATRLMSVPGVGPITALVCDMKVPDVHRFESGRHFAAWLGLTPKQHSSGTKVKLGSITKAGDEDLRSLLVMGAASVLMHAKKYPHKADEWVKDLQKRRPFKVAAVALAARNARIVWALMKHGTYYQAKGKCEMVHRAPQ
jgi:transposase